MIISSQEWVWLAVFGVLVVVAVLALVVAIARRERQVALWALVVSGVGALAGLVAMGVVFTAGVDAANAASAPSVDPSQRARELATGLSLAMNGVAFGLIATFINALAALGCLLIAIFRRPENEASEAGGQA